MKIVVVGGGTAGWITLSYLAATTNAELTIVHSNEIDPIGVGESTTPTIKHVADAVGINEDKWMKDAKASFKYGIEFLDFNAKGSRWLHAFDDLLPAETFSTPIVEFGKAVFEKKISSVEYFLTQRAKGNLKYDIDHFNFSHGGCEFLLQNKLSPFNRKNQSNFSRYPGYSYHINAFEFGNSLKKHTPKNKYTEIVATIKNVEVDDTGVKELILDDGSKITGDLYIDCTGFKRLLIGKFVKFIPYTNLLNNAAVWGPVKTQNYRPSTLSIAQDNGWIWETPTWGQIGTGYVYSNDFITEEQAIDHLTNHWRKQGHIWEPMKSVKFESGRLERVAYKNVVSNGLGQSFIEPLEATSVMVTCMTAKHISKIYNRHNGWNHKCSKAISVILERFLMETKEFVEGHYTLSDRNDSEYWRAYDRTNVVPYMSKKIKEKLEMDWVKPGETVLNGYNWASMLVAYDKPYLEDLPFISEDDLLDYEFYTDQLIQNYEYLYKNNLTVEEKLKLNNR